MRTAAYVVKDLLDRAMPYLVFEKFGQAKPIPANSTSSMKFRRYFLDSSFTDMGGKFNANEYLKSGNFNPTVKVLTEGQTPSATSLKSEDIQATLSQYGDLVTITDVIMDTHEDPILREATQLMSEQAAVVIEKVRFNALVGGTNVMFHGSAGTVASRGAVNAALTGTNGIATIRKAVRSLKRNLAKPITSIVRSTAAYGTQNVSPGFVAVVHPDLEPDLRGLVNALGQGFVPAENYGQISPWENEIGKFEDVRFVTSTIMSPWSNSGVAVGATGLIATGPNVDVYPVLIFAKDAYGIVPLKGGSSITPVVWNPKVSESDPLAQRGHVGWKAYQTAVILNDAWMCRIECGASAL